MEDGANADNNGSDHRPLLRSINKRHTIRRLPRHYEWSIGEQVVLLCFTAAGVVPSATFGILQGFTKHNGRKMAIVCWEQKHPLISSTVAIQRIRPIAFIPR